MDLRFLKTLHIIGVVLFMGNIVVTALWKALADRSGDPRIMAFAQRLVTITVVVFTGAGAALVAASGLVIAPRYGGILDGPVWLVWGWWMFVMSGVIWVAVLIPIQIKQWRLVEASADGGEVPTAIIAWRAGGSVGAWSSPPSRAPRPAWWGVWSGGGPAAAEDRHRGAVNRRPGSSVRSPAS